MTTFHVIRSVKGGSGKTAFALHYVAEKATEKEKASVLYVDADVHASETRNNLFEFAFGDRYRYSKDPEKHGGDKPENLIPDGMFFSFVDSDAYTDHVGNASSDETRNKVANAKKHSLNTFIHPYRGYYSEPEEIIIKSRIVQLAPVDRLRDGSSKKRVDMIFADPDEHGRRVFGSLFQSAGQSAVGVGAYVAKIKTLLKYILECGKQYTDVVLDMPPGSDTFSEHLMDCLINFVSDNKEKCKLCVYYVATRDRAHIRTAAEAAIDHLHMMRAVSPQEVCFVDNTGVLGTSVAVESNTMQECTKRIKDSFEGDSTKVIDYELSRLVYYSFLLDRNYKESSMGVYHSKGVFFSDEVEVKEDQTDDAPIVRKLIMKME